MIDIRRGDILDIADSVGEVLKVDANADGGLDVLVRVAECEECLRPRILKGRGRIKHGKGLPPGIAKKPEPEPEPEPELPEAA